MSVATDILLAPDVRPFAVAAAIMVSLGGIELLTMIVGFSISELLGHDFGIDSDSHNGIGGLFLWINAGRLPLLILHSPTDNTVGIENASEIFRLARHPRSFVSLEGSDHLLTARGQDHRAGRIIGAWADAYLGDPS